MLIRSSGSQAQFSVHRLRIENSKLPRPSGTGFGVLLPLLLLAFMTTQQVSAAEWRAFWVDTWGNPGILNQSQVDTLLGVPGNASSLGRIREANCNAVFIEVRRNCDACYPSSMGEPYMSGLSPSDFNALQACIDAAHDTTGGKKRVEVHCWIVTFRTSGGLVYSQHSDTPTGSLTTLDNYWPSRDDSGAEVSDKAFDPGHPLALQYTVNVAMDLVNNFDIDGIHYDYIRFTARNQGYNPTSIARYNARYGLTGQPSPDDAQFMQWRRNQVTALVRQVYARIQKSKPWVKQSGAFVTWNPSPVNSTRAAFQATRPYGEVYAQNGVYSDWDSWLQEGIVDMAVPMTYYDWAALPDDYTRWMNFEKDRKGNRHMIIGPGTYHNDLDDAILELQMTRDASPSGNHADGFCCYSYRSPYYLTWNPTSYGTWAEFAPRLIADVTPTWADIPDMPWKTSPINGHLMGTVTIADTGAWADGAVVSVTGPVSRAQTNDGTGFYAFIDLPPGSYNVFASLNGYPSASATVAVAVGEVTGNMYERDLVLGGDTPPSITAEPQSQTVIQGAEATFTVSATGSEPLGYQWRFNGTPIADATDSTYTRSNVQLTDAGSYSVVVTNTLGSTNSADAVLTVHYALTATATAGGTVSKDPDQTSYAPDTVVTLAATPDTSCVFIGWSGDAGGTNNPLNVTMTANKAISGTFVSTATDIILDNTNPAVSFIGTWQTGTMSTDKYGDDYRFASTASGGLSNAIYRPYIYAPGYYDVSVWYPQGANRADNAPFTVVYSGGTTNVPVDQTTNGGGWLLIAASCPFAQGTNGYVSLSNDTGSAGKVVIADAVRFTYVGPITLPPSPQIEDITLTAGGQIQLQVNSAAGHWAVDAATSLALPDWAELTNFTTTGGTTECLDSDTSQAQRFYRVRLIP